MKKTLFLISAMLLSVASLAGCNNQGPAVTNAPQDISAADFAKDADKNIDMDKVLGTALTASENESAKGEVGDTKVEITDATMIDYNGENVVVVSFEFTNKTGEEATFSSVEDVTASQDGAKLPPAVVLDVDGIDCNTIAQPVKDGDTITVQKAFYLRNADTEVNVTVTPSNPAVQTGEVSRTFNFQ